jgi:hypothetical protein
MFLPSKEIIYGKAVFDYLLLPNRGYLFTLNKNTRDKGEAIPNSSIISPVPLNKPEEVIGEPSSFSLGAITADCYSDITDDNINSMNINPDKLYKWGVIDESNSNGVYILYPQNIQTVAYTVWQYLRAKFSIENLGVIITDSHTTPMRRGVTGITLGWCGFEPLYSYVNKPDIYGNLMRVTQINILDALATTAVFVMGEGSEQTPMAVINNAPKISFVARPPSVQEERNVAISIAEDLYAPLLMGAKWLGKTA